MSYRLFHLLITGILLLLLSAPLNAQENGEERFSFEFRGDELSEVLEIIAKTIEIDLVYDPELVKDIYIHKRVLNSLMPDLLQKILEDTQLDFITLSTGTIVIVKTVHDKPSYGSFAGKVIDSQTGEPLPGATVMLADAYGGTSTNRSGSFNLNRLISGSYNIVFSYVGYEPVYKTIEIRPNELVREEINLDPKPYSIAPVIVTGHLPQMPRPGDNSETLNPDTEWEPANGMRDAIQSLNLFTGIQYGLPMTDLHLQGGQRGEHRMLLDGVPVYNPYSFGQMFSAFSPYAIGKVSLHKAGYGVQEGSQIAGLIDLHHDVSSVDDYSFMVQGDPLSINSRVELNIPFGDDSPFKMMTAFRTNYWNIYRNPTLEQTLREWDQADPLITNLILNPDNNFSPVSSYQTLEQDSDVRFHDLHFASRYEFNMFNVLSASFYKGKNFVSTDLLAQPTPTGGNPPYMYARDEYQWNNQMGQITHNWLVSPRIDLSTKVSYSSNSLDHRYLIGTSQYPQIIGVGLDVGQMASSQAFDQFQSARSANRLPAQNNENRIRHIILRSDANISFTRHYSLDTGIQFDMVSSKVNLSELFYLPTETDQESTLTSAYLDNNWRTGDYWNFSLGSRFTWVNPAGTIYPEPRGSIQFDKPDSGIGYWSLRLSGGLYRQYINQFEITNVGPTALVPSFTIWSHSEAAAIPKAYHLSTSFLLEPDDYTSITLEAFHKWQPTTYITSYNNLLRGHGIDRSGFDAFAETTSMKAYGIGTRINREISRARLQIMFGYDYSISNIDMESQFGRTLPASWNEPHRLQVRSLWRAHPNLTAVIKWQSIAGRTWGFRQAYYNFLLFSNSGFSFTTPDNDRLSPFHQLDLSFIFRPSLGFSDLEVRMDLVNILNRKNVIDWSLQPTETEGEYEIRKRTMPGFAPSVSIQLNF